MGFGISTIVNTFTKSALIEWVDPEYEDSTIVKSLEGMIRDSITPDVKKTEIHKMSSSVTETILENGSVISEHIIQSPVSVTLSFEETNGGKLLNNIVNYVTKRKTTFDKLVDIWERKIQCTIITEHKKYNNMVISNMPIVHKEPYKGAYQIMVDFKQINTRNILTKYRAKDIGTIKSSMQTLEGGFQQTKKV